MFFEVIAMGISRFKSSVYALLPVGLPPELATLSQLGYGDSYLKTFRSWHSLIIPLSVFFPGRSR